MSVNRPYRRTCRQFVDDRYGSAAEKSYVNHPKFATSPEHYIRAFGVLQKDFKSLLDYIEPAFKNSWCYSFRTHELLIRICIEIEANFKAILSDNDYKSTYQNMKDYKMIEKSHLLSSFQVKIPNWRGPGSVLRPFEAWSRSYVATPTLRWYDAYNNAKHDRQANFEDANFGNVVNAIGGLVALLSAQFLDEDFHSGASPVVVSRSEDGFEDAIGGYFRVSYPDDWPATDRYDFNWTQLKNSEDDPFQCFDFSSA